MKTWSRTSFTGGSPTDARCVLITSPNRSFALQASKSHSARLSLTSDGNGRPGRCMGGWCGDGRETDWKLAYTYGMPSLSATDRTQAAAGSRPVATSTSHPSAASATVSNCASSSAARRGTPSAPGGVAAVINARTDRPNGTSGTPTPASRRANSSSGGAHTRTSAPSSRSRTASPTSGSTPPRES